MVSIQQYSCSMDCSFSVISLDQSILWMYKADKISKDLKLHYSYLQQESSSRKQGDLIVIEFFCQLICYLGSTWDFHIYLVCSCTETCLL